MRGGRPRRVWCAGLAEYRLDDLARISGVSSRNIRAYRERGLLDPPRRQGRSAFYDDYHLSQLKTINQLLRKGFNSAHIAEFFARMREGHDLAAILGFSRRFWAGAQTIPAAAAVALDLDPGCDEAQRLVSCGLAELVENSVSSSIRGWPRSSRGSTDQLSLRPDDPAGGRLHRRHDRRSGGHAGRRARRVHRRPLWARLRAEAGRDGRGGRAHRRTIAISASRSSHTCSTRDCNGTWCPPSPTTPPGSWPAAGKPGTWPTGVLTPASSRDRRRTAGPATPG